VRLTQAKQYLARWQEAVKLDRVLLRLQRIAFHPFARAINYHAAPQQYLSNFEMQVKWYAENFVSVDIRALEDLHRGIWSDSKPGLIISFDDGLREPYENALPILERYGFKAWFFVPVGFVETPPADQHAFASGHSITLPASSRDSRIALSWEEIRDLEARGHVVGCHTYSHHRMTAVTPPAQLRHEIIDAKELMEKRLGHEVSVFCWVGGEESSYSSETAELIRAAGYRMSFMTNSFVIRPGCNLLQLQRTNIECDYPLSLVRFQLAGFMDVFSTPKRRRVVQMTA